METKPLIDPLGDYKYFAQLDYWTTGEAASLTLGLDPEIAHSVESRIAVENAVCDAIVGDFIEDQLDKSTTDDLPDILKRLLRMVKLIERSADTGSLPIHFENPGAMQTLCQWDRYQFLVLDFINWAESRGIDLPEQLIEAARKYHVSPANAARKYHVSPANEDLKSSSYLTDEWQAQICEKARRNGFIARDHLVYILAKDEQYTEEKLQSLWKDYQINKRGSKKLNVSTAPKRIDVWHYLLWRWTFGSVAGVSDKVFKDINCLSVYAYDQITGELKDYNREEIAGAAYVKLDDLKRYFDGCKVPLPSLLYPQPTKETPNVDEFVKSLRVEVENDSEITIQVPGKTLIAYNCKQMGFKNGRTKTWKLLVDTLKDLQHIIKLPARTLPDGRRNTEYDKTRGTLGRLNTIFLNFLRKEFGIDFPENYKIYFLYKPGGVGSYAFKFKVPGAEIATNRFENMSKERLLKTIDSLYKKYQETEDEDGVAEILSELGECLAIAKAKKYLTQEELESFHRIYQARLTPHKEDIKQTFEEDRDKYSKPGDSEFL